MLSKPVIKMKMVLNVLGKDRPPGRGAARRNGRDNHRSLLGLKGLLILRSGGEGSGYDGRKR